MCSAAPWRISPRLRGAVRNLTPPRAGSHRPVDAGPQVHRVQLLTAAGLEVDEQLRSVRGVAAQDRAHQPRSERGLLTEKGQQIYFGDGTDAVAVAVPAF